MQRNPMGALGYDVDIETGGPVLKKDLEQRRHRKIVEEGQALVNELSGGNIVAKQIIELYLNRVNELINNDAECQVFEKLLSTIELRVNIGKEAIEHRHKELVDL